MYLFVAFYVQVLLEVVGMVFWKLAFGTLSSSRDHVVKKNISDLELVAESEKVLNIFQQGF